MLNLLVVSIESWWLALWDNHTAQVVHCYFYIVRVPTRTGKPGKMGRHFPVREKSGNFEQTGKVMENYTKYWKNEKISDKYYLLF